MELDYTSIFQCFTSLITTAIPVAIFLYLVDIVINLFFSLAFPKFSRKRD